MGNWRNRRPRRFFYEQYIDPASSYYDPEEPTPNPEFAEDGVPSWEKKFCSLIGSVPWKKVVNVKKFMYCHGSVLNWDDSAGEEAFQNAKKRFWAEINGLTSEISLPNPDKYIDKINWNPDIDPELIKDLECSFFAPEEGEKDGKLDYKSKKFRNSVAVPSEAWNRNSDNSTNLNNGDNPWDHCSARGNEGEKSDTWGDGDNKLWGWNNVNHIKQQMDWDNNNVKNDDNPWECNFSQGNEDVKGNTWGDCSDKVWGWSHGRNQVNRSKDWDSGPWKRSSQGVVQVKEKIQGYHYWDNNLQQPGSSWRSNFTQGSGSRKDRQWKGCKRWDNHYREPKGLELGQVGDGWGTSNDGNRKREGTHQCLTGNKQTRFQGNGYQTGHRWRG
ncbi:hypothetical protein GH714_017033 [Hevea brasiliensis]|uniref:Uncharacterized protein n=1 Tax=Hevea brasiliensis TaxID=3981 RepID=A0A6A6NCZ3_HEVBR|nr:hypothetical protein GH714_017033 [Hevea brasiliensis]